MNSNPTPLKTVLYLPDNDALGVALAKALGAALHPIALHRFPDEETLVTVPPDLTGQQVLIACTLDRPDSKLAPLLFAANAVRDLGATKVGLVAPYLAYMRQDKRFHAGEAVSSRTFADTLSRHFDFLVTVDPHLHRYRSLDEVFSIPSAVVSAAPAMAAWVHDHIANPLLIGPDGESLQWIEATARYCNAPFTVLEKTRRGDTDVSVTLPDVSAWRDCTPVLLDDIVSSARTMMAAAAQVRATGLPVPWCVGVHAIFAQDAFYRLSACGVAGVVSCNTILHPSNGIDVVPLIVNALQPFLSGRG